MTLSCVDSCNLLGIIHMATCVDGAVQFLIVLCLYWFVVSVRPCCDCVNCYDDKIGRVTLLQKSIPLLVFLLSCVALAENNGC